jgi:hypothetical protein
MTRIKRALLIFYSVFSILGLAGLYFAPVVYAGNTDAAKQQACQGIGGASANGNCSVGGQANLNNIIRAVVAFFSVLVGVAAVVMIMVGGFKYITSGGDSGKISSAKSTIIYALVGLVIVALAQFIVRFAIRTTTNPPDTNPNGANNSFVERV